MNDPAVIRLSWSEVITAAMVGVFRQVTNLRDGRADAYGASDDRGWQLHIEGCCGEMAFAKLSGLYWSGSLGNLGADDVHLYQVRTTSRDDGRLIVHPGDPDDRVFVLVTGRAPTFRVRGWVRGIDAKNREWWHDPSNGRPAFFVPQSALRSIETIEAK